MKVSDLAISTLSIELGFYGPHNCPTFNNLHSHNKGQNWKTKHKRRKLEHYFYVLTKIDLIDIGMFI